MGAKHTPGPWSVRPTATNFIIDASDGLRVTALSWQPLSYRMPHATKAEAEANARLIASAPDLLEALILLEAEMVASGNAGSEDYGWPKAIVATRAAIAKATGEAS